MTDLIKAKKILDEGNYTCVLCRGDTVYTSDEKGIRPMIRWIEAGVDLSVFSAADKIIGKAAALLFVLTGVRAVYAPLMSEGAVTVFSQHNIKFEYIKTVSTIINRKGDGPCPMERSVFEINDPALAYKALVQKLTELRKAAENQITE